MNKMGILPIAAALIAFACAPKTGSWPQEVNKYVHRYGDLSKAHNNWSKELREVTIKIVDSVDEDPTTVGVCYSDENYIEIKRSEWDRYDDLTRQALVFHELGHCVHHFEHRGYLSQKLEFKHQLCILICSLAGNIVMHMMTTIPNFLPKNPIKL